MIITKYVTYRNKEIPIEQLKPNSKIRITVKCPQCNEFRSAYYSVILSAGHTFCRSCNASNKRKLLTIGEKYGKLTVINHSQTSVYSIFRCDCGNITEKYNWGVRSGNISSCGCLRIENMKNIAYHPKGENHPNWKGGVAKERERVMQTKEYKEWRKTVFERDNEHIRTDIENGITFCEDCHRNFHSTYGNKTNDKQLEEFLNNNR